MKQQLIGTALLWAITPCLSGQDVNDVGTPLPQGQAPLREAPSELPTWEAEQRDGYFLEESIAVEPRFVFPET